MKPTIEIPNDAMQATCETHGLMASIRLRSMRQTTADRSEPAMLGMKTYTQSYIDACRARVDADLRAYRKQVGKAPSSEFAVRFWMVLAILLENYWIADEIYPSVGG